MTVKRGLPGYKGSIGSGNLSFVSHIYSILLALSFPRFSSSRVGKGTLHGRSLSIMTFSILEYHVTRFCCRLPANPILHLSKRHICKAVSSLWGICLPNVHAKKKSLAILHVR
jgi:hypothetical protein